jgi:hypothetical protein
VKGKSEKKIKHVAEVFVEEITSRFPGVTPIVMQEAHSGYDLWISVRLPVEMARREVEILDATIDISDRLEDETGISSYATVGVSRSMASQKEQAT